MTPGTGLGALLVVGLGGLSGQPPATGPLPIVQLRVFAHATMDGPALEVAKSASRRLLEPAGIGTEWRNCSGGEDTCTQPDTATQVIVLLMPIAKWTGDEVSAEVLHGPSTPVPTVLVYMPNLTDRLRTVQQSGAGRSNPALATLQLGDLVGLAIAHEIGHAFGLGHTSSGVMKKRIAPGDLLALATSRLAFSAREAAVLRQSVATGTSLAHSERGNRAKGTSNGGRGSRDTTY
jgi:hypothetical protein